jgi:deoxyadenosine/deoxycytidine kinase
MHRYIAIEGPIGVGKTALATRLASRLDATTVTRRTRESVPRPTSMPGDRSRAAGSALLLLNRHRQQISCARGICSRRRRSRTTCFDRDKIFAYLNLDDNELFIYQRLYDLLVKDISTPDLVCLPAGSDGCPAAPTA